MYARGLVYNNSDELTLGKQLLHGKNVTLVHYSVTIVPYRNICVILELL